MNTNIIVRNEATITLISDAHNFNRNLVNLAKEDAAIMPFQMESEDSNFEVVVSDSDKHSDVYVMTMLGRIFKADKVAAAAFALRLTTDKKAVMFRGTREHCRELAREIASFGGDLVANTQLGIDNVEGLETQIVRVGQVTLGQAKGLQRY